MKLKKGCFWRKSVCTLGDCERCEEDDKTSALAARLFWGQPCYWVNVCGLAYILVLTSPNNQVSLTTKKRGAQGMVPSTIVGKAPSHLSVLQAVLVTRMRWDTLLAMRLGNAHSVEALYNFLDSRLGSQTNPLKEQRFRPHTHRKDIQHSTDKQHQLDMYTEETNKIVWTRGWYGHGTLGNVSG